MMSWKYTLPAFVVPFMFTSHPNGIGLLLKGPWSNILLTNLTAFIGVGVLAAGICGWLMRKTSGIERILLIAAGFILVYPNPVADLLGLSLAGGVALSQWRARPPRSEIQQ
jgi:TRAP-type uncharacterized transport system fused permease subunit